MSQYVPPFSITNQMLSLVGGISEKIGRIDGIHALNARPRLRRSNQIRSIHSTLLIEALRRVALALNARPQALEAALAASFLVSADNAHAAHPNHPEKYDEQNRVRMNGGVVLNPYTGTSLFEAEQLDPKVANAIRNLEVGDVSKPFETEDEQGHTLCKIVLLRSKTKPHKANLTQDYQRIQNLAIERKKGDVLEEWLANTIEATYIKIDDDFKKCKFRSKEWLKSE